MIFQIWLGQKIFECDTYKQQHVLRIKYERHGQQLAHGRVRLGRLEWDDALVVFAAQVLQSQTAR